MSDGLKRATGPVSGAAYFGAEVREWRLGKGLSQREVGAPARYGQQYVAKVEAGDRMASPEFADGCDQVFGTPGMFARLRDRCAEKGGYPDWFEPYRLLELRASAALTFSNGLIAGLLQTEAYAHAMFRKGCPTDDLDETAAKVARRLKRREVLERENPPLVWVVLDESCLRRTIGSPAVMAEQLAHLIKEAESPRFTIQLLPFSSGAISWHLGFTLLKFDDDEPDMLYQETLGAGHVTDSRKVVAEASLIYDRMRADALSPAASLKRLREVMKDWTR
ncbi:helix-turn-helix transcriptional regulator [Streptomyces scopuliridis]|uniref:DNA-binding protein n=2 Tax=Streptomyces scopuliridis TaxID=452529 RepID=A0A2T7TA71_9ACTN|nr:helix-turn-helix transcriptional regulator [Streptomyces scopuliridis]PVE11986.1 DNA-binding protein [Streptomyces scopuliridis RB72]WSB36104.1 helix-turn-helix transcriptional regulator [Streptomyces scopuliridis]WSC00401.1 helix-turn-helix transcriptional regulator [Streptomyces scopuliridis]WSC05988.1 helix-turn-helix transcriptional regulator [Streptomyces scopuliridis]